MPFPLLSYVTSKNSIYVGKMACEWALYNVDHY